MISVGTVWDRTTEVIAGRFAILAAIALIFVFVPALVQSAVDAAGASFASLKTVGGLVALGVAMLGIIGSLAITAVATDPAVDRVEGVGIGGKRLWPMIGVLALIAVAGLLSVMPALYLFATSGFDMGRAALGQGQEGVDDTRFGLAMLYSFVIAIVWLWLGARLLPLVAVVVNERLGIGAIARAFSLTRGSTLKLIGVLILYSIVLIVAVLAATSIIGVIVRLIVGADNMGAVTFAAGAVGAAITAAFSVVQAVFSGQFYLAARSSRDPA